MPPFVLLCAWFSSLLAPPPARLAGCCRGGRVALDVARALTYLHEALGVVHYDVKAAVSEQHCPEMMLSVCMLSAFSMSACPVPQNVLLTGDRSTAKLVDAGFARALGDDSIGPGVLAC